ncbi:hypothetical protein Zm00014a_006958 [Zea mays]|uniref:Uncharacterized protein n=1 Tax=Zea mays TaxID=4577 RepID=A0A3L6DJL7_MAIZE|nr:hypothetical protein Zm00014a_006958 [Zea mays]
MIPFSHPIIFFKKNVEAGTEPMVGWVGLEPPLLAEMTGKTK